MDPTKTVIRMQTVFGTVIPARVAQQLGKNLGLSRGWAGIQSKANTWKVVLTTKTPWPAVALPGPSPAAALRAQLRPHQHLLTPKI